MQIRLWQLGMALTMAFTLGCGGTASQEPGGIGGSAGSDGGDSEANPADAGARGGSAGSPNPPPPPLPRLGSACVPAAEFQPSFSGFAASDVTVEAASAYCPSGGVCLIDHFEGRVSCPYGQLSGTGGAAADACSVPGSEQRVTVGVEPQRLDRRSAEAVYCSWRCAGPDPNASYQQCEPGFSCVERIPALPGVDAALAGSYCVRNADALPNPVAPNEVSCDARSPQCGNEKGLPPSVPALVPTAPVSTATSSPFLTPAASDRKLDLLFMVDNSIGMRDAQEILARSVGALLERLANPICVDGAGREFAPPAAGADCPTGQRRQFEPFSDLHVGFVSSSLGDAGANVACPPEGFAPYVPERVDGAHLLGSLPRGQSAGGNAQGFLEWHAGQAGFDQLSAGARRMLSAAGEHGCGWEHSLESWYRFLVDPVPYRNLERVVCPGSVSSSLNCVRPAVGPDDRILLDETLLTQRQAFLRPDSTLAIVMLTDENDCSLQVGNQTWVVVNIEDTRPMFRASSICEQDPNDRCCYICPLLPPDGCAVDPVCTADANNINRLPPERDGQNLRCFDQKRRFGLDFLYPTQRYVNALTQPTLCWNALDLATTDCALADIRDNGLFAGGRRPEQIVLAGLLGVPWQALAASGDGAGNPLPLNELRFKSGAQLRASGDTTWAQILGSPGVPFRAATDNQPEVASVPRVAPTLPQMVESELPRAGILSGNALNGRDYSTVSPSGVAPDDLEYACLFPLTTARDCAALDPNRDNCACYAGDNQRPLCEQTPGVSTAGTTQYWGGAKPATRQLQVLKALGDNAVVTSLCARNTVDPNQSDFGYRPALGSLLERLQALDAP